MLKEFFSMKYRNAVEILGSMIPKAKPVWLPEDEEEIRVKKEKATRGGMDTPEDLRHDINIEEELDKHAGAPNGYDEYAIAVAMGVACGVLVEENMNTLMKDSWCTFYSIIGKNVPQEKLQTAFMLYTSTGRRQVKIDTSFEKRGTFQVALAHPNAKAPQRATDGSGAYDIYLPEDIEVKVWKVTKARTGLKLQIPTGYVGLILPRSSTGFRDGVDVAAFLPADRYEYFPGSEPPQGTIYDSVAQPNRIGVIDADYRGEVYLALTRTTEFGSEREVLKYKAGDRVAQLLLIPVGLFPVNVVTELDPAPSRGENGFGSTGA